MHARNKAIVWGTGGALSAAALGAVLLLAATPASSDMGGDRGIGPVAYTEPAQFQADGSLWTQTEATTEIEAEGNTDSRPSEQEPQPPQEPPDDEPADDPCSWHDRDMQAEGDGYAEAYGEASVDLNIDVDIQANANATGSMES